MSKDWSDSELFACVDAYLGMAKLASSQSRVVKKPVYEELAEQTGRSAKSIELRMQNISSVVMGLNRQFLQGLAPASNVGSNVYRKLADALQHHPDFSYLPPLSYISYKDKLPAIRDWLIRCAQARTPVFYSDTMLAFDLDRFNLRRVMDFLGHEAKSKGEPILTALIVSKSNGRCSKGIEAEFGIQDDVLERDRLYEYWAERSTPEADLSLREAPLKERAVRFASVEIRPSQAAFRRRVFERCNGRCVISRCRVDQALDAAHRKGRVWREGHNSADDGFLLRKDLHALYDRGLLSISEQGVVTLSPLAAEDYSVFAGVTVLGAAGVEG